MEKDETTPGEVEEKRNVFSSLLVGLLGAFSAVYLFNPTAGFFEFIPDNIPVIGNLDEAAAAGILISCLAYFGMDVGGIFGRKKKENSDVIDVEVEDR